MTKSHDRQRNYEHDPEEASKLADVVSVTPVVGHLVVLRCRSIRRATGGDCVRFVIVGTDHGWCRARVVEVFHGVKRIPPWGIRQGALDRLKKRVGLIESIPPVGMFGATMTVVRFVAEERTNSIEILKKRNYLMCNSTPAGNDLGLVDKNHACSCNTGSTAGAEVRRPEEATSPGALIREHYLVDGMTCGHCVSSVTEQISALHGVIGVTVELNAAGTSRVLVTSSMPVSEKDVQAAVTEAGYKLVAG